MRIHIIGQKKSGKTTYCTGLMRHLSGIGRSAWYLKHSSNDHPAADLGADTGKLRSAGASLSFFETEARVEIIAPPTVPWLADFRLMQEWQHGVTLIEGHRRHKGAKYEVIAPGAWNDSYCKTQGTANLVGLISDEKLDTALPVFRRDDYVGLLDHADGLWQNSKAHKQLVRRYINWLKRQHSAGDLRLKSGVICDQIRKEPAYELAKNILLYWPMAGEVDLTPLLEQAGDKVFCLPIVEADGQLSLGVYQGWKGLVENSMGISEPLGAPRLAIETIDLILTPGMAFTRCGKRLGRGGGFYDRLLEKRLARQSFWGIGFDFQVLDDLPMAEHDHPVDRVFWG